LKITCALLASVLGAVVLGSSGCNAIFGLNDLQFVDGGECVASQCTLANALATCAAGSCAIGSCLPGYQDCDLMAADGCESDTATDVMNCGGCANACAAFPNAAPACTGGTCTVGTCNADYGNCDGIAANGCEANILTNPANCGSCGDACMLPNAVQGCTNGMCSVAGCMPDFADCNGIAADGCETNTTTSAAHCGGCGHACMLANAIPACMASACAIGSCMSGFADCDLMTANGCETPVDTTTDCGFCGVACANPNGTTTCTAGACLPTCTAGYADCDGNKSNGCEASLSTTSNCGVCGNACSFPNAGASCTGGACTLGKCNPGWGDCDGNPANGCETNLNSNAAHCGSCASFCFLGKICAGGACANTCPAGSADCDADPLDGCETNTASDGNNCGGCNIKCADTQYCAAGTCTACPTGQRDCDKDGANTCESSSATDSQNCGACGTKCGSDGTCGCAAGTCSGGTIYFSEAFAGNAKGWTLGKEWAIGPTLAGSGQAKGFPDPTLDHTTTADNGVAGIVLGGNYLNAVHPPEYLVSPTVDLSAATGTVYLAFWRWLNCDISRYLSATIDVSSDDGLTWTNLYTNPSGPQGGAPTETDDAWSRQQLDVTTYKSAHFRVRFGHEAKQSGQFLGAVMSGWNIDDLSLSGAVCN
jgi:hypothetical protein